MRGVVRGDGALCFIPVRFITVLLMGALLGLNWPPLALSGYLSQLFGPISVLINSTQFVPLLVLERCYNLTAILNSVISLQNQISI